MSRRDTIIIAVLLNAGLLIVLFATSLKSDKTESQPSAMTVLASNQPEMKETKPPVATITSSSSAEPDQVDQMIQQYVTPQVATLLESNPNFLADLQAIGSVPAPTPVMEPQASAAIAPVEMVAADSTFKEVKVKKGDVLERIARQNRVTVSQIMKANKLTSTRLKIGQVLKIPSKESSHVASAISSEGAHYYTIKAGDNPWTIAVKHHMKVEELLKLNSLDEQKAKRLKAGDKIRIR